MKTFANEIPTKRTIKIKEGEEFFVGKFFSDKKEFISSSVVDKDGWESKIDPHTIQITQDHEWDYYSA